IEDNEQVRLLRELATGGRNKQIKKKQTVYETGDTPIYVYYINKGQVRSYLHYKDGRELSTNIFIKGEFFGLESVLRGDKYADSTAALEDSEITLIDKDRKSVV